MLTREWATLPEMATLGLPGIPDERALQIRAQKNQWNRPEWRNKVWRKRDVAGGGIEYSFRVLDRAAQLAWMHKFLEISEGDEKSSVSDDDHRYDAEWKAYGQATKKAKSKALKVLGYLDRINRLVDAGLTNEEAIHEVRMDAGLSRTTIQNWLRRVKNVPRNHWLPMLVDQHKGNSKKRAACDEQALEAFKSLWLRPEKPTFEKCFRDLVKMAEEQGWVIPSINTLKRRVKELPQMVVTMARAGKDAAKQMIPAQERDRTALHALQAVNADGHKWDIFVLWPDGTVARPIMAAWQDLYSNMILSWRIDRSENTDLIQLAFGDMVEKWGIPEAAYLDNGRAFASKRLTGGSKTRFRFKVKENEVNGVMTILGVKTHWTTPYSGQSKPIERSFRDMEENIAKDVRFSGAYVGNNPLAKPENYGSKAIPLEEFLKVISEGIKEHNNRPNRNTLVCGGKKSFFQAFSESMAIHAPRKATQAQRHLWLMAAENVTVNKKNGSIRFMKNRYFADFLHEHLGASVVVRYDPQDLHADLHVYDAKGSFLGNAPTIERTGFTDTEAATTTARSKRQILKARKQILDAERTMTPQQLADMMPEIPDDDEDSVESKVVRPFRPAPITHGNAAVAIDPEYLEDDDEEEVSRVVSLRQFIREQN